MNAILHGEIDVGILLSGWLEANFPQHIPQFHTVARMHPLYQGEDYPFLTSTFGHPVLPWVGELPLASAAAFDFGVFLVVVGATVLALTGIGRLARRER